MAANEITEHGGEGLDEELIEKMADMKERIVGDRLQETKEQLELEVLMADQRSKLKSVLRKVTVLEVNIKQEDVTLVREKLDVLTDEASSIVNDARKDDKLMDDLFMEIIAKVNSFKLSNSELNSTRSSMSSRSSSRDRDEKKVYLTNNVVDPAGYPKIPKDKAMFEDWMVSMKQRIGLADLTDRQIILLLTDERICDRRGVRARLQGVNTAEEAFNVVSKS